MTGGRWFVISAADFKVILRGEDQALGQSPGLGCFAPPLADMTVF
jgi:hypothetical protein